MSLITDHAKWLGYGFVALALVLLLLALRHWLRSRRGGRRRGAGSALVRPVHAGDARARDRTPIGSAESGAAGARSAPAGRESPPIPVPARSQFPVDIETRLLKLEEQVEGIQNSFRSRVVALEQRIKVVEDQLEVPRTEEMLSRLDPPGALPTPSASGRAWDREHGRTGDDSVISQPIVSSYGGMGSGLDAPAGDSVGVEIRGSEVVASQSYPPEAYLTVRGGGVATLVLNPEVPHNAFALDRFALFFDLGERREGMYRTTVPAEVKWDGQRGTLRTSGTAVAR
jgi:hypothetical protein